MYKVNWSSRNDHQESEPMSLARALELANKVKQGSKVVTITKESDATFHPHRDNKGKYSSRTS
jgi:hypothetical protein